MAMSATPEQLERLIEAGQSLERHAREWADELTDSDSSDGRLYGGAIEEIEADIARFNAIRRELEGVQLSIQIDADSRALVDEINRIRRELEGGMPIKMGVV